MHIKVPQIPGLRLPDIIDFAEKHIDIHSFLPEYRTFRYPSRQWVWNIGMAFSRLILAVATLAEKEFREFIKSRMDQQEAEFSKNRNTNFKALPNFVSMVKDNHILSSKQLETICRIKWKISSIGQQQQEEKREAGRKDARNDKNHLHERRTEAKRNADWRFGSKVERLRIKSEWKRRECR